MLILLCCLGSLPCGHWAGCIKYKQDVMLSQPITSNYKLSHRIGKRKRARGGYSRFPISNIDSRPAAAAADSDGGEGDAAAAVCAARQDSERNSRLRQKSWEPNSFRCCRTHAEARGKGGRREGGRPRVLAAGIGPGVAVVRRLYVCGQGSRQGGDWGHFEWDMP